jgi:hypothetical protein
MRTLGVSQKAILAFFFPFLSTCVGVAISWAATGQFNASEIRIGAAGLATSGLASLGAYLGQPGAVVPK